MTITMTISYEQPTKTASETIPNQNNFTSAFLFLFVLHISIFIFSLICIIIAFLNFLINERWWWWWWWWWWINLTCIMIIHVDGSREGRHFTSVCLCVCFPHDISKTDPARITKLDIQMFHDEFWKLIYFVISRSKVKVTSHKNIAVMGFCTLVSADVL